MICRVVLFIISICLFTCSYEKPTPYYITLVHQIISEHADILQHKKSMHLVGSGGELMNNVKKVTVDYCAFKNYNLNEARILYVYSVLDLLEKINTNDEILPYLNQNPFTEYDMQFYLRFHDKNNKIVSKDNIALIFLIDGKIHYHTFDPTNNKFIDYHEETFADAKKIVENNKENLNLYSKKHDNL